jgi:hypothetical protein
MYLMNEMVQWSPLRAVLELVVRREYPDEAPETSDSSSLLSP